MARKEHFTLRLNPDTVRELERKAERSGQPKTVLAERYLEEGLRMAKHPGIIFRDGPAGRRPGLAGHLLDVWEIIETVHNEGGDRVAAAMYFGLSLHLVNAAFAYYVDYPKEIDAWIECNTAMADEEERAWRQRQNLPLAR